MPARRNPLRPNAPRVAAASPARAAACARPGRAGLASPSCGRRQAWWAVPFSVCIPTPSPSVSPGKPVPGWKNQPTSLALTSRAGHNAEEQRYAVARRWTGAVLVGPAVVRCVLLGSPPHSAPSPLRSRGNHDSACHQQVPLPARARGLRKLGPGSERGEVAGVIRRSGGDLTRRAAHPPHACLLGTVLR